MRLHKLFANPLTSLGSIKALALLAVLVTIPSPSHAGLSFGVGPKGGMNWGWADVDDMEDEYTRKALALGVTTELGVTSPFSLMVEAMYLQRGARFKILGATVRGDLDYLEIPILGKAKFGKPGANLYIFAGPAIGILLSSEGKYLSFESDFDDSFSPVTFSGEVGAGVEFALSKYVYLVADGRYSQGFSDALDESIGTIDSWNSRDIRVMGGLLFHLTE